MTIALLSHTYKQGNSGGSGTSPAIDTTGASLLVAYVADFTGSAAATFADSQGNTWTALTARPLTGNMRSQMYYCASPTTSASHTFSATGTNSFAAIAIAAYSGTATSPYDQETGATTLTGTSLATGSVTPSENNELVIYGCGYASSALSVSVGTMLDTAAIIGGTSYGIGLAYEIQTTATARSPSWSWSSSNSCSTTIATFKATTGSSSPVGLSTETDTALALAGVQIAATGIALETDTALALTGITGTAPGIASESDTAFALAAVQKLLVGVATETDTALAPTAAVDDFSLILKILRNRQELNAATGMFTLYDDDGTTVLYQSNAWADAAGTIPYSGGVLARIDALA
jgi:hypothetical protein